MSPENQNQQHDPHCAAHQARSRWVFIGFALVAGYFLFTEHRAHVMAALPYLLLAACPLMHLFMHHGHGHHHHEPGSRQDREGDPR